MRLLLTMVTPFVKSVVLNVTGYAVVVLAATWSVIPSHCMNAFD
jgi:hypothetical protein